MPAGNRRAGLPTATPSGRARGQRSPRPVPAAYLRCAGGAKCGGCVVAGNTDRNRETSQTATDPLLAHLAVSPLADAKQSSILARLAPAHSATTPSGGTRPLVSSSNPPPATATSVPS